MTSHRFTLPLLALIGASVALACEEPKKEEPKKAATAAAKPGPTTTVAQEPEPAPKEEPADDEPKDDEAPKQTPLEKCCTALARGGFTVQGPQRQNFMKGAAACREGVQKKQKLAAAMGPIKKAMGSATMPPDCL